MPEDNDIESFWEGLRPPRELEETEEEELDLQDQILHRLQERLREVLPRLPQSREMVAIVVRLTDELRTQLVRYSRIPDSTFEGADRLIAQCLEILEGTVRNSPPIPPGVPHLTPAEVEQDRLVDLITQAIQERADSIETEDMAVNDSPDDLFGPSEVDTELYIDAIRNALTGLGFSCTVRLSEDTGTLLINFPPRITVGLREFLGGQVVAIRR